MMDTLFFWVSKLIWLVISPDMLLVFLAVAGLIALYAGAIKKAGILFTFLVLSMGAITVLPLGQWVLSPLENRFPVNPDLPEDLDGIIMLGGSESAYKSRLWGQPELKDGAERYLGFITLAKQYPDAVHLFTGGSGDFSRPDDKDAHVAGPVFKILGLDSVVFEDASRNTYENGGFSKAFAKPESGEHWVLVTTSYHMPRAVGVFEKIGWQVIPYPVDHYTYPGEEFGLTLNFVGNLSLLTRGVREWVGLCAYYITGKTSALFPGAVLPSTPK